MLKVTTCNSLLAIFAGLLSDLLVRGLSLGPLAPFLAAIVSFQIRFLGKLVGFEHYRSAQTFNIFSLVWQPAFSQSALVGLRTTAVKRAPWWKNIGKHVNLRYLGDNHSCFREGASSIFASPTILRLGIVQALVEVRPLLRKDDQPCSPSRPRCSPSSSSGPPPCRRATCRFPSARFLQRSWSAVEYFAS